MKLPKHAAPAALSLTLVGAGLTAACSSGPEIEPKPAPIMVYSGDITYAVFMSTGPKQPGEFDPNKVYCASELIGSVGITQTVCGTKNDMIGNGDALNYTTADIASPIITGSEIYSICSRNAAGRLILNVLGEADARNSTNLGLAATAVYAGSTINVLDEPNAKVDGIKCRQQLPATAEAVANDRAYNPGPSQLIKFGFNRVKP